MLQLSHYCDTVVEEEMVCNVCVPISQLLIHNHTPSRTPSLHLHATSTSPPISTSLESVLPIWSSSVQSPRLQPDARVSSFYITSLIPVLLSHGPLCTFLRLILLAFLTPMVPRPCPTLRS
ncbi:hypothetical protein M405DRAFT_74483 [Rhizopogon salebrosus TDB-379]|nr:hypothetical protein M405DRAFT_74483 [Rhizopogon salebrosus TDB-379]